MAYVDTGEKIRELRKSRNLSQDQLAELASLNRVTIAKYEAGKVEPGAQALSRIADALEVTVDEILGRADPDQPDDDDDVMAIREQLRRDPNMRILFEAVKKSSPEHLKAAAAMLQALKEGD